jgi:hypothetical protein
MTFQEFLSNDLMWVILSFIFIVLVVWLYNLNKTDENDIHLIDLIATDGKLEERKITRFGAWIISSWGLIYLISINELKEWYFISYMGAWVVNALIGSYISKDKPSSHVDYPKEPDFNPEELNNPTKRK